MFAKRIPEMPIGNIDQSELHYDSHGSGPPLLLIHGLGSSRLDWENQVDEFSKNYLVIAPDCRGHGKSSTLRSGVSIRSFTEDMASLLKQLTTEPAHIVGVSMGGMIAFQLAASHPDQIRSLTVVNSTPELLLNTWNRQYQFWKRWTLVRLLGMDRTARYLSNKLFPHPNQFESRSKLVNRWSQNDLHAYLNSLRAMANWSVEDQLSSLRCPTLVVSGDRDYTTPAEKMSYVSRIPNARLVVISDSGHATPADQPTLFNQELAQFLESV